MTIYLAHVEETFTYQRPGRNEGQWHARRRWIMVEAADIHEAQRQAERVAETNVMFGPRPLGVEVLSVCSIQLPAEVGFRTKCDSAQCHSQEPKA